MGLALSGMQSFVRWLNPKYGSLAYFLIAFKAHFSDLSNIVLTCPNSAILSIYIIKVNITQANTNIVIMKIRNIPVSSKTSDLIPIVTTTPYINAPIKHEVASCEVLSLNNKAKILGVPELLAEL